MLRTTVGDLDWGLITIVRGEHTVSHRNQWVTPIIKRGNGRSNLTLSLMFLPPTPLEGWEYGAFNSVGFQGAVGEYFDVSSRKKRLQVDRRMRNNYQAVVLNNSRLSENFQNALMSIARDYNCRVTYSLQAIRLLLTIRGYTGSTTRPNILLHNLSHYLEVKPTPSKGGA